MVGNTGPDTLGSTEINVLAMAGELTRKKRSMNEFKRVGASPSQLENELTK